MKRTITFLLAAFAALSIILTGCRPYDATYSLECGITNTTASMTETRDARKLARAVVESRFSGQSYLILANSALEDRVADYPTTVERLAAESHRRSLGTVAVMPWAFEDDDIRYLTTEIDSLESVRRPDCASREVRYRAMHVRVRVENPDRTLSVREMTLYFPWNLAFATESEWHAVTASAHM